MRRLVDLVHRHKQRKFVRDTLILQLGSIVTTGTYLVTSLLTARLLGREELGRWATSRELYMFAFFMVSMGLTNAAVSRYSQAKGRQDDAASVEALASLLKLGAIVTLLVVSLGVFVAPPFTEWYYGDREIGIVTTILCFSTVGEVLRAMTAAVLNGTRQMKSYALFDALTNVLRVGLVGTALLIEASPQSVAWAFLAHGFLSGILAVVAYRRARRYFPAELAPPPIREVLASVPTAPMLSFFGLSFLLALSKAMNTIVPRLGMIFIPALAIDAAVGFSDNGAYQVGMVLNMVLAGVIGAIATNALPTLGLKMGESEVPIEQMGRTLRKLSLAAGGLAIGATVLSVPVVWMVIRYGYGTQYLGAFEYYLLLATGNLFIGFAVIVEPFYIYAGRMHHHVPQSLVYATLATLGIYSATVVFGPKGAAAAGGLCRVFVLFHLVYIWIYFRRARRKQTPTREAPAPSEG